MAELMKEMQGHEGERYYICDLCKEKYDLTEARQRILAGYGKPLKLEVIMKSSPEPFGP